MSAVSYRNTFKACPRHRAFFRSFAGAMPLKRLFLFLLLVQNPCWGALPPEQNILNRGLGTSFSTDSSAGISATSRQMHMQVCITIGCCRHVCRQFAAEHLPEAEALGHSVLRDEFEPGSASSVSELLISQHLAVLPEFLDWSSQPLFSPSIKYLTVLNTANDSLEFDPPESTDDQFYGQASEERTVIAPGESLNIPIIYLPQQLGEAAAKFVIRTSAGDRTVDLRGNGVQPPYQVQEGEGVEVIEGETVQQVVLSFHNPHDEVVWINEVQNWPGDSHKRAFCSTASDGPQERVISCSEERKGEKSSEFGSQGVVDKLGPKETAKIFELVVPKNETWIGSVYIKLSRNTIEEVMILPLRMQASKGAACSGKAVDETVGALPDVPMAVRPGPGTENSLLNLQDILPGKLAQADSALKPLIRDLGTLLLRQSEIKVGSLLPATQNQAMLIAEKALSFSKVQLRRKAQVWINLTNPSEHPVSVKLEVTSEVKSASCKYKASWFRQAQESRVEQNSDLFEFEEGALVQAVIQAQSRLAMGPLTFSPNARCEWSGILFIRNSLSGLEWLPIHGRGGSAGVSFLDSPKGRVIKSLHLVPQVGEREQSPEACKKPWSWSTNFSIKNTGDLALQVDDIRLRGDGFKLENADNFSLAPGEIRDLAISYKPDFKVATRKALLEVATSVGVLQLPVVGALPRELVALCIDSPLHEKLLLPISLSALVVVLGVFSRLLLRELHQAPPPANKPRPAIKEYKKQKSTWRRVFDLWRKGKSPPKKLDFQILDKPPAPVKLKLEQDVNKSSKKKKKNKTSCSTPDSSAPSSPLSSASDSPHSVSESEKKEASPIEKILDASRFSRSKSSKLKVSSVQKQEALTGSSNTVDEKMSQVEASFNEWNSIQATRKTAASSNAVNTKALSQNPVIHNRHHSAKNIDLDFKVVTSTAAAAAASTPPLSPTARAPGSQTNRGSPAETSHKRNEPLTSIGRLRQKAAEVSSETIASVGEEVLYDIWGDHFAKISTPAGQQQRSSSSSNTQSLFSQSLPTWSQDVPSPSMNARFGFLPTSSQLAFVPGGTSSSIHTSSYLFPSNLAVQSMETYPGLPEPTFDLCTESIYQAIVS